MPIFPLRGIVLAVSLITIGSLLAEVVTLDAVADTLLFEFDPDYNFGRQRTLPAGAIGSMAGANGARGRALYKFDLALPPGSTIQAARMTLSITPQLPLGRAVSDFALNRVLVSWSEGAGFGERPGGRPAIAGEATWNNRMHPDQPWSVPGGAFGSDFATEASAVAMGVDGSTVVPTSYEFVFNGTGIFDLDLLIKGTLPNFGWVLHSLSEGTLKTARHWISRETITEGPAPALEITFTRPPIPDPRLKSVEINEATQELCVRMDGLVGYSYQLQCGTDLASWSPAGAAQVPLANGELEFRLSMEGLRKFVRVERSALP